MALPSVKDLLEEDIFKLLGVEDASEDKKTKLLASMIKTVDARIINRVSDSMEEKEAKKFGEIAETGDSKKLVDFLVKQDIDLPKIISEEVIRYRVEIAGVMALTKEK